MSNLYQKVRFELIRRTTPLANRVGLSEGSFVGSNLWVPHFYSGIFYNVDLSALPGVWFCQDFSNENKPIRYGSLFSEITSEMINNSPDELTPFKPIASIDDVAALSSTDSSLLLNRGLLRWTSYEQAYRNAGILDKYAKDLEREGILEEQILTVTPKGNGRVWCMSISGSGTPKTKEDHVPVFGGGLQPSFG